MRKHWRDAGMGGSESEKREVKNEQEKWHQGELEEGSTEAETDGDVNLFAEALTVLILNKEVKLIRCTEGGVKKKKGCL